MNYWLLTSEYPPFFGGGISTYCYYTAKMLSQNGHKITVFINDASVESFSEAHIETIRIIRFNPNITGATSFLGHVTNISYAFAQTIKHYIEQEGTPDLIEAQEYLGIAYYLLQYKTLQYEWCRDVRVLITAHSPAFLYLYYNQVPTFQYPDYWIGEMERFCLQAATGVVSPSHYLIQAIKKEFDFTNPTVFVIPNPFELQIRNCEAAQKENNGKIIFYGKLSAQKGTFKLLNYFETLWNEGFKEPLHLYGGEDIVYHPEGKTMGALVREKYRSFMQIGLLHLHGQVRPEEVAGCFANAKLIIVPSTIDNLPYVVLEMMALGNIVLVSKQGGQAEVITDGMDGFIFDHEAPHTFKEKLFQILMLSDAELKTIQQHAKQKIAATYNLETIYAQKIAIIEGHLAQSKPSHFPFIRQAPALTLPAGMGFSKSLLSVVVPYYNMGRYIQQTMDSLRRAQYENKEIIIVNDGSTDAASIQQLEHYRNQSGITILDIKNKGLASARNTGATAAKGEYLSFLDADDTVTADYYTKAIGVLKKFDSVHFVGCWTQYVDGSANIWPTFTPEPPLILYHNTVNSSALVYKKTAFLHKGVNDAGMTFPGLEDYESVIALLAAGYRGVTLPEALFNYRVRPDSMIRAISKNKKVFLFQYISTKHKQFYATFAAEVANLLQANGPGLSIDNPSLDYLSFSRHPLVNRLAAKTVLFVKRNPRLKKIALAIYRKLKS